jgi:hypothetical protein
MAIEDNTVGYDVLSYELSQYGLNNVLIEVKSTVASPLRFIVTRNEWDEAQKFGDAYVFHVWDLDKNPEILHVRTSAQVAPHIPADNQQGKWQTPSFLSEHQATPEGQGHPIISKSGTIVLRSW